MSAKVQAANGGESPSNWSRLSMGQVGRWMGGGTPSKANNLFWTGGSIPWVSPKDMKSDRIADAQDHITHEGVARSATNLVEAGSVLIVVRSGILQHTLPVAVTESQVALNQDLKAVTPNEAIRPEYLALALKAFERDILHTCTKTGTTVQSLEMPAFLRFEIPVAPRDEQSAIVAEVEKQLTRLDAGVAALRRVQANLKRYRAAVLKAACEGRLVPTEAELARKEGRTFETGTNLLARILRERRESWRSGGTYKEPDPGTAKVGVLPDGWARASVAQLSTRVVDGTHHTPEYLADGVAFISVKDIRRGVVHFEDCKFISREAHADLSKRCHVERGDVLITKSGTIGRIAVVETERPFSLFVSVALIKPVEGIFPSAFLALALGGYIGGLNIAQDIKGALLKNLHLEDLRLVTLPLPPLPEQRRIMEEVGQRLSVVEQLEATVTANLQRATRLRQSVLQSAFGGRSSRV